MYEQGKPGAVGLLTRMTHPEVAVAEAPERPSTMKSPCRGDLSFFLRAEQARERASERKKGRKNFNED